MLTAKQVAEYFLSKDEEHKLFNKNIVVYNDRKSYEGNIRINKYLFLAQVVYLAKYGRRLFADDFVAYDNGPIIEDIMHSYGRLLYNEDNIKISEKDKNFLDKIYFSLENATYADLIEITHDDPEWQSLSAKTYNAPKMDLEKNIEVYKKKYKGLIEALNI